MDCSVASNRTVCGKSIGNVVVMERTGNLFGQHRQIQLSKPRFGRFSDVLARQFRIGVVVQIATVFDLARCDIEDLDAPEGHGKGLSPGDENTNVRQMQEQLQRIGYDLSPTGTFDDLTEAVVRAFQRRWLPDRISGAADIATLRQIGVIQALYAAS